MRIRLVHLWFGVAFSIATIVTVVLVRTAMAHRAPARNPLTYTVPAIDADSAVRHLSAALQFPTISFDERSDSAALAAFRDWVAATYTSFHSAARHTVVDGSTLIYEWTGQDASLAPIVLMAHQDVVPIEQPDQWTHPPFSGAIAEGAVWGRGALDCKGSLVAIMEAAESLAKAGHSPQRTLYFVFGHDEESMGSGARAAAAWLAERHVKAAFVLDEGGVSVKKNPVTGRPATLIGVAEKGNLTLQLTAKAAGGHSNAPPENTAIDSLAEAILAIRARPFPTRYEGVIQSTLEATAHDAPFVARMAIANDWLFEPLLVSRLTSIPAAAATLRTTIAPTMLQGSPKLNVLPSAATAAINFRLLSGETIDSVVAHVRDTIGSLPVTVEIVGVSEEPSPVASTDSDGYRLLSGIAEAMFEGPVAPLLVAGLTDSRSMRDVADNIYRYLPIELSEEDLPTVHGINERIRIDQFTRMIAFYQNVFVGGSAKRFP